MTAIDRARLASFLVFAACGGVAAEPVKIIHVDCTRGESIAKALERGDERKPLILVVRGVCQESVRIERDDVTLRGDPGAGGGLSGPDAAVDTLTVAANRVTLEAMAISGGRNGITGLAAGNLNIRQSTVQSTGRTGIAYAGGSSGVIDACTVRLNPRDGVVLESSSASIIHSTVSENSRFGIQVTLGGAGRIGIDPGNAGAGNTIRQNGSNGIVVIDGGSALIAMNEIDGNGTDPAAPNGRGGISVSQASADIAGGNTITNHPGQGVFARGASVIIGNPSFDFGSVNTISANGSPASSGGVFGFLGSSLFIRDAQIVGNNGFGLFLSTQSRAQLLGSTIQGTAVAGANPGDGIRLAFGSALFATAPTSSVSANAGAGLRCTDLESSFFAVTVPPPPGLAIGADNGAPSTTCSGF